MKPVSAPVLFLLLCLQFYHCEGGEEPPRTPSNPRCSLVVPLRQTAEQTQNTLNKRLTRNLLVPVKDAADVQCMHQLCTMKNALGKVDVPTRLTIMPSRTLLLELIMTCCASVSQMKA
jgi:hypothetical protein